jgi:hypothetical protein
MEIAPSTIRLNRWSEEPVLKKDGSLTAIAEHALQPLDLKCFELLARFRYLRTPFFPALIGGNPKHRQRRLSLLARQPNRYLNRPETQRRVFNANYRDQIFELGKRGEAVLKSRGVKLPAERLGDERLFEHSMMVNDVMASLAIGIQPARIVWWDELCSHPKFPAHAPRRLHVKIRHQFEHGALHHAEFDYQNDSNGIFAIDAPGQPYRFFSLEAEHTNRVATSNLNQTSFLKKFLAIQSIMENGLYKKAWGIPNLLHLVVVPSQARINTMKALIMRLTNNKGASYVLFREIPVMSDINRVCKPMPELYTAPWQRAGHSDLCLTEWG